MKFYNIFTESVDALKLDNIKSVLIKKLAKAVVESIEPGEFQVYQRLDNGVNIIYKISETSGTKVFNFINLDGELVSDIWFTAIVGCGRYGPEYAGLYRVSNDDKQWNILCNDGTFLTKTWCDNICPNKDGLFIVRMNDQFNFMNMDGDFISNDWFVDVSSFNDGVARVATDGWVYNYINRNGEYLSENTFSIAHDFSHGVGLVSRGKGYNYINTNGDFISDMDFDWAEDFDNNGLGCVTKHIDRRKIDENGNLSESDVVKVNLINEHGDYLLDKWVDEIRTLSSGGYQIFCNNQDTFIDANGNILREWMDI